MLPSGGQLPMWWHAPFAAHLPTKRVTHLHETSNRTVLTDMAPPRNGRADLELHGEFPLPVRRRELLGSFDTDAWSTHARIP